MRIHIEQKIDKVPSVTRPLVALSAAAVILGGKAMLLVLLAQAQSAAVGTPGFLAAALAVGVTALADLAVIAEGRALGLRIREDGLSSRPVARALVSFSHSVLADGVASALVLAAVGWSFGAPAALTAALSFPVVAMGLVSTMLRHAARAVAHGADLEEENRLVV